MRLIDADKLKDKFNIKGVYSTGPIWDEINDMPTAYDVDKVVEQLNNMPKHDKNRNTVYLDSVIDIVKGGLEE